MLLYKLPIKYCVYSYTQYFNLKTRFTDHMLFCTPQKLMLQFNSVVPNLLEALDLPGKHFKILIPHQLSPEMKLWYQNIFSELSM